MYAKLIAIRIEIPGRALLTTEIHLCSLILCLRGSFERVYVELYYFYGNRKIITASSILLRFTGNVDAAVSFCTSIIIACNFEIYLINDIIYDSKINIAIASAQMHACSLY
ncbi:hypothetical protein T12_1430 [Trichinella patagoniensis]|uniref:Uncharacterized protein n=1 Tax=Trichinella patagoniensis TaxID=990121 RepID=A0A0V0ZY79_9BILA|nr:hypothetical protein T12_1430 [Trichinella patagoniensis]